jgi:Spy/CpxP family protein refolding chaperone
MTTILAVLAAAVFAMQDPAPAPAPQQDGDGDGGGRRPRRMEFGGGGFQQQDPERQAEQRARWLKEQLGLSDDQLQKAADIYKQSREAEQKLETDRQAKLRELLTDDQKKKYDEILAAQNRPRTPLSGFERMMDGWADTLKRELSLDDATMEKVKPVVEEFRKKIQERGEKLRADGFQGMNWQEEMQKFQDGAKEAGEKIKEHLTPEQKEKFDKLVERFQPGRGGFGAPGGGERRGPPSAEERATRAVETLKISDSAELAAVKAAVRKVYDAQHALGEFEREYWTKVEELRKDASLTDEQVNAKLNELRASRLEKDKAVKAAQGELREIISVRQELELFRHGALR